MATKKNRKGLSAAQIRAMNDLGPMATTDNPLFFLYMDGKKMYSITTGERLMTAQDSQYNLFALQRIHPNAHFKITLFETSKYLSY